MLDPYVRATLAHDDAGRFAVRVTVPDTYGVFKWVLEYRRLGYSFIELTGGCAAGGGGGTGTGTGTGQNGAANLHPASGWGAKLAPSAHVQPANRLGRVPHAPPSPQQRLVSAASRCPAETVPIRPFKHHEYERFIVQAYPYYASVASMMAGFMAVGFFFLYTR